MTVGVDQHLQRIPPLDATQVRVERNEPGHGQHALGWHEDRGNGWVLLTHNPPASMCPRCDTSRDPLGFNDMLIE